MDPLYSLGYRSKYVALLEMKSYKEACATLSEMFSRNENVIDPEVAGDYLPCLSKSRGLITLCRFAREL